MTWPVVEGFAVKPENRERQLQAANGYTRALVDYWYYVPGSDPQSIERSHFGRNFTNEADAILWLEMIEGKPIPVRVAKDEPLSSQVLNADLDANFPPPATSVDQATSAIITNPLPLISARYRLPLLISACAALFFFVFSLFHHVYWLLSGHFVFSDFFDLLEGVSSLILVLFLMLPFKLRKDSKQRPVQPGLARLIKILVRLSLWIAIYGILQLAVKKLCLDLLFHWNASNLHFRPYNNGTYLIWLFVFLASELFTLLDQVEKKSSQPDRNHDTGQPIES